jgi:hypothetical protein
MAGMAAGSALWSRGLDQHKRRPYLLAGLQGALAVLAVGLALWLKGGVGFGAASWTLAAQAGYVLVLAAAGFAGGGVFALSAARLTEITADAPGISGRLYAADLLGATFGTLGVSLIVLPVWGIVATLGLVAFCHAAAAALALIPSGS